ncbi:molybdopterin molybdotransferase MoeA [Flavobacterium laiguense]|uniref:Molybdopterin molybdenumtransferase n=1 Tax=Flavobacterium laiguense TaxID=2169409 RepID=A0A2U1JSF0_9FLAO|nr:gephyrin-like molybdotransferase Glp [Flavobacterium laiguense]PWA07738.1 molybdopterin molybdenumtransferase MoeA [Flavobacterium laiguense]
MISVQEAFSILQNNLPALQEVECPLSQARKHILAQSLFSPINMPPFRQSAMDGYALCLHDGLTYEIVGEIKAGDSRLVELLPGQAVKIFTGAAVPDSAQAVIQIEKVAANGTQLLLDELVLPETNVRPIGEQISAGDLALEKGTLLNAAAIGFLAGLGFTEVMVYKKPKIGIVVTGNELSKPGMPLEYGKVYESNGIMLQSALIDAYYDAVRLYEVNDDFDNTKNKLKEALTANNVVLVSGGISVGDYDFVARALHELEVETLFYKVNQKPGKPLFAGKLQDKMVFALPGNPAACLTCFYVYVLPTLAILSGAKANYNQAVLVSLADDYVVKNTRCQFLKANVVADEVSVLPHQASSMLNSFSVSNGLIYLPDGNYELKKGDKVEVYLL